eukprot:6519812-Ditylum_brightwellii.AAC.1
MEEWRASFDAEQKSASEIMRKIFPNKLTLKSVILPQSWMQSSRLIMTGMRQLQRRMKNS